MWSIKLIIALLFVSSVTCSDLEFSKMKIKELKAFVSERGADCNGCSEKSHWVQRAKEVQDLPIVPAANVETASKETESAGSSDKAASNTENQQTDTEAPKSSKDKPDKKNDDMKDVKSKSKPKDKDKEKEKATPKPKEKATPKPKDKEKTSDKNKKDKPETPKKKDSSKEDKEDERKLSMDRLWSRKAKTVCEIEGKKKKADPEQAANSCQIFSNEVRSQFANFIKGLGSAMGKKESDIRRTSMQEPYRGVGEGHLRKTAVFIFSETPPVSNATLIKERFSRDITQWFLNTALEKADEMRMAGMDIDELLRRAKFNANANKQAPPKEAASEEPTVPKQTDKDSDGSSSDDTNNNPADSDSGANADSEAEDLLKNFKFNKPKPPPRRPPPSRKPKPSSSRPGSPYRRPQPEDEEDAEMVELDAIVIDEDDDTNADLDVRHDEL